MVSEKNRLVSSIVNLVKDTLNTDVFADESSTKEASREDIVPGISDKDLVAIVTFVVDILPEKIYLNRYKEVNDYAARVIAKELILFLAQEDVSSDYFKNNLENFRDEILGDILGNVYLDDNDKIVAIGGSHA